MSRKLSIPKAIEVGFDLFYLAAATLLGVWLVFTAKTTVQALWGVMALVLAGGDAFHLVPRILFHCSNKSTRYQKAMGIGKEITSITMTVFYLILWYIGIIMFQVSLPIFTALVWLVSLIRIVLCLCPQNQWAAGGTGLPWGIYRNIPFCIQGAFVALLYAVFATKESGLTMVWLAVVLSFLFYLPVVLFAHKNPKIGMLMLPKTCVYLWIIATGFSL